MNPMRPYDIHGGDETVAFPSRDEIERHMARSRLLRVEATAAMLSACGRALARPLHRLARPLARRQREQQPATG